MAKEENGIIIEREFLENYHLKNPHQMTFAQKNIIIGMNGAGKTRFLKAVKDHYIEAGYQAHEIVFADFPHMVYEQLKLAENAETQESETQDADESDVDIGDENSTDAFRLFEFFAHNSQISLEDFMIMINRSESEFIEKLFSFTDTNNPNYKKAVRKLNEFLKTALNFTFKTKTNSREAEMTIKNEGYNCSRFKSYFNQASPGERNLFNICVFLSSLAAHRANIKLAVILDEPELHLHFERTAKFIEWLKSENVLPGAHLWVATHSVLLIPQFQFGEIIFINDQDKNGWGVIQKRGSRMFSEMYRQILGESDELDLFLRDIDAWDAARFASECFADPATTSNKTSDDPQIKAFRNKIKERLNKGETIRILDYGAGTGRFGFALSEDERAAQIECYRYDKTTPEHPEIDLFNPKYKGQYVGDEELPADFDFVLLVNTLHEINPKEWSGVLKRIHDCLKEDGELFFCEARALSLGENLGKDYGYLVLNDTALQRLFDEDIEINLSDKRIEWVPITKKRLAVFAANKPEANRKISAAVQELGDSAEKTYWMIMCEKAKTEDSNKPQKTKTGRELAFHAIQHMNAYQAELLLGAPAKKEVANTRDSQDEQLPASAISFLTEAVMLSISTRSARQFMNLCAYMKPENVPLEFFIRQKNEFPQPIKDILAGDSKLDQIINKLQKHELVQRNGDVLQVNRAAQAFLRAELRDSETDWLGMCLSAAIADVPTYNEFNKSGESREWFESIALHAAAIAEYAENAGDDGKKKQVAWLYKLLANRSREQAHYTQALEWGLKAVNLYENCLDSKPTNTAEAYKSVAWVFEDIKNYDTAAKWHQKALITFKEAPGKERSTAWVYKDLGDIYYWKQDFNTAFEQYQNAKEIFEREKHYAMREKDLSNINNCIANVLHKKGENKEALELYWDVIKTFEKVYGKEHLETAFIYSCIGGTYLQMGKYDDAKTYLIIAYCVRKKILGENHPHMQDVLRNC